MVCLVFMSLLLVRDDMVPNLLKLELAEAGALRQNSWSLWNLVAVVAGQYPILENVRYALLYCGASCGIIVL